jgi:hypothetical protein
MKAVLFVGLVCVLGAFALASPAAAIPLECEELLAGDPSQAIDCAIAVIWDWISGGAWDGNWIVGGHGWA